ncbi:MFS transporter [Rhizobium sp. BK376]|uniref:MFS transporter n=1 Tax=Rhizobium sp. BK376 TaxID=2512149 RepID=UPI0010470348|nr:MFS transporter [Rhizobium sp. BK376]TCR80759.1 sugar phosphate permease [Rhizobium sp. BK376]
MDIDKAVPKPKLYYGWVIVFFSALMQAVGPGQVYLNGIIIVSFRDRFAVSNEEILLATTGIMMISYGISSALFGILVGRVPLSWFSAAILTAMSVGYLALSMVTEVWQVAVIYALVFGIGQMALPVAQTMIARWFTLRRGLAFGIASCGFALPGFFIAPLMTYSIGRFGFSPTMVAYGVIIALMIPFAIRLIVNWPEDKGLFPDGMPDPASAVPSTASRQSESFEVRALIRSPHFWVVGLIVTISPLIVSQLMTYLVPMANASHVDLQAASFFLSGLAVSSVASKLLVGWLADRIPLRVLTTIPAAGYVIACLLFMNEGSALSFGIGALIAGASGGASAVMMAYVVGQVFGRNAFGTVAGLVTPIMVVLSLAATWTTGRLVDLHGHYQTVLQGFIGLSLIAAALSMLLRPTRANS